MIEPVRIDDDDLEALADYQHQVWSNWMRWQIECGTILPDGALLLPGDRVGHWIRQMETRYDDLSEEDKEKDRDIVRAMFAFVAVRKTLESMELARFDDDGGCVT